MIAVPTGPIVDKNGEMTIEFLIWVDQVTANDPIIGTGSPEGVIEALQGRLFIDTAAGTGSVLYVKRDGDDGSGDRTKGWILV